MCARIAKNKDKEKKMSKEYSERRKKTRESKRERDVDGGERKKKHGESSKRKARRKPKRQTQQCEFIYYTTIYIYILYNTHVYAREAIF